MSESAKRDGGGWAVSAGFILLGVFALWGTRDMSALGSVFPRTIGSAMIVLSALDIVWHRLKSRLDAPQPAGSAARRVLLVGIMLAWALLLRHLGFFVTSVAATLLLLIVGNYDRWTPARTVGYVLSTFAVVGGLYLVFAFGLKVPLPTGILF